MRKLLTIAVMATIIFSCKNAEDKKEVTSDVTYPYSLEKPDNWDIGSKENTLLVMNALKAFEDNKVEDCLSYFADTVRWRADYMDQTLSKDSLRVAMTNLRNSIQAVQVKMGDFESVISKDKKDEWVTLWYTEIVTDKTGKTDSLAMVNDIKVSKGKIVELNESVRHFPTKKL
ncbi:MAG: hypothetical protein U1C70_07325 [Sediminibacterium sp.]|jgi:hypothetical protein|uniref:hypothetical protein n=1 Tax=Sediminibacterium sp. TaxID=1917865 RepID=UPI002AB8456B|nr:hypothetical protein [Sediminibacterium sp.]MDZ4071618.1 hypothetical protein [Sediminibacterium sp.]